jgi:hypothetical protein
MISKLKAMLLQAAEAISYLRQYLCHRHRAALYSTM